MRFSAAAIAACTVAGTCLLCDNVSGKNSGAMALFAAHGALLVVVR